MDDFVFGSLSTTEKRLNYYQKWRQGVKHHSLIMPRAPQADDPPVLTVIVGLPQLIDRIECEVILPETAVYQFTRSQTEWDLLNWQYLQHWQVTLPPQPDGILVRYAIKAYPADGSDPILADDGEIFSYYVGPSEPPAWSQEAIVYQIFPDRFFVGNGRSWNPAQSLNDIYGGTLRGIIQKLDYVAEMGFNAIWLNPFFPDESHHGYHATDYFTVNPRLGSMDDIRELVATAHSKGIRLLLDFVANHWGSEHHSFQEAIRDPHSSYVGWYNWIDYPHDYETFFGVMDLPQVNVNNPEVRKYLLDSVRFWLGDVGFDGLRLDYALGPTHDFWTELRATVKQIKPDAWIFGEVVETPTTLLSYDGRLDGCLDFSLEQAMRDTFALQRMTISEFASFLIKHERFFPETYSRPSFLDNHDMNRFYFAAGHDKRKLKLAALCQFTLVGPPIVYNGTEVGVKQLRSMSDPNSAGMEENRQPMLWGDEQDDEIRDYFRWLIQFRKAHPALRHGRSQILHANDHTLVYARTNEQEMIWVALNVSEEAQAVTAVHQNHQHTFTLQPWSGDVHCFD
ncbi:alpha-amylase family glycosyl hydrolase [Candidatus Leptofilum sp.]|uniref:alpha-amylase family glycosyl hydrolase n=1 Tax=Candidatus Leptofilum sp. TaxID=3241576 RepID=UPI003B5A5425